MRKEERSLGSKLLTEKQVCQQLQIGRTTLWHLRRRGELPAVYIGRAVRYRASDVRAFIERNIIDSSGLGNPQ